MFKIDYFKEHEMLNMLTVEEQEYYLGCDPFHNEEIWKWSEGDPAKAAALVKSWFHDMPTDDEGEEVDQ